MILSFFCMWRVGVFFPVVVKRMIYKIPTGVLGGEILFFLWQKI